MKKIMSVLGVLALLGWTTVAEAQTQRPPQAQMGGQAMMGPGMMEMMCPMMMGMMMARMTGQGGMPRGMMGSGMMGEGMAGMSAMGNPADPKAMARMLRLRSDMMKAMSEVMLKHAQELEQEK